MKLETEKEEKNLQELDGKGKYKNINLSSVTNTDSYPLLLLKSQNQKIYIPKSKDSFDDIFEDNSFFLHCNTKANKKSSSSCKNPTTPKSIEKNSNKEGNSNSGKTLPITPTKILKTPKTAKSSSTSKSIKEEKTLTCLSNNNKNVSKSIPTVAVEPLPMPKAYLEHRASNKSDEPFLNAWTKFDQTELLIASHITAVNDKSLYPKIITWRTSVTTYQGLFVITVDIRGINPDSIQVRSKGRNIGIECKQKLCDHNLLAQKSKSSDSNSFKVKPKKVTSTTQHLVKLPIGFSPLAVRTGVDLISGFVVITGKLDKGSKTYSSSFHSYKADSSIQEDTITSQNNESVVVKKEHRPRSKTISQSLKGILIDTMEKRETAENESKANKFVSKEKDSNDFLDGLKQEKNNKDVKKKSRTKSKNTSNSNSKFSSAWQLKNSNGYDQRAKSTPPILSDTVHISSILSKKIVSGAVSSINPTEKTKIEPLKEVNYLKKSKESKSKPNPNSSMSKSILPSLKSYSNSQTTNNKLSSSLGSSLSFSLNSRSNERKTNKKESNEKVLHFGAQLQQTQTAKSKMSDQQRSLSMTRTNDNKKITRINFSNLPNSKFKSQIDSNFSIINPSLTQEKTKELTKSQLILEQRELLGLNRKRKPSLARGVGKKNLFLIPLKYSFTNSENNMDKVNTPYFDRQPQISTDGMTKSLEENKKSNKEKVKVKKEKVGESLANSKESVKSLTTSQNKDKIKSSNINKQEGRGTKSKKNVKFALNQTQIYWLNDHENSSNLELNNNNVEPHPRAYYNTLPLEVPSQHYNFNWKFQSETPHKSIDCYDRVNVFNQKSIRDQSSKEENKIPISDSNNNNKRGNRISQVNLIREEQDEAENDFENGYNGDDNSYDDDNYDDDDDYYDADNFDDEEKNLMLTSENYSLSNSDISIPENNNSLFNPEFELEKLSKIEYENFEMNLPKNLESEFIENYNSIDDQDNNTSTDIDFVLETSHHSHQMRIDDEFYSCENIFEKILEKFNLDKEMKEVVNEGNDGENGGEIENIIEEFAIDSGSMDSEENFKENLTFVKSSKENLINLINFESDSSVASTSSSGIENSTSQNTLSDTSKIEDLLKLEVIFEEPSAAIINEKEKEEEETFYSQKEIYEVSEKKEENKIYNPPQIAKKLQMQNI